MSPQEIAKVRSRTATSPVREQIDEVGFANGDKRVQAQCSDDEKLDECSTRGPTAEVASASHDEPRVGKKRKVDDFYSVHIVVGDEPLLGVAMRDRAANERGVRVEHVGPGPMQDWDWDPGQRFWDGADVRSRHSRIRTSWETTADDLTRHARLYGEGQETEEALRFYAASRRWVM